MIDKFLLKFFGFFDDVIAKVEDCFTMDFSHCEKHDCPKRKRKQTKIINILKVNERHQIIGVFQKTNRERIKRKKHI